MADGGEADDTAEVVNSGEWKKCIDSVARAVVVLKVLPLVVSTPPSARERTSNQAAVGSNLSFRLLAAVAVCAQPWKTSRVR